MKLIENGYNVAVHAPGEYKNISLIDCVVQL